MEHENAHRFRMRPLHNRIDADTFFILLYLSETIRRAMDGTMLNDDASPFFRRLVTPVSPDKHLSHVRPSAGCNDDFIACLLCSVSYYPSCLPMHNLGSDVYAIAVSGR